MGPKILILTLIAIAIVSDGVFGVKRPDYFSHYKARARLAKNKDRAQPAAKAPSNRYRTLNKFRLLTFTSSKRCCKLAEQWADMGMGCTFDPYAANRRKNAYQRAMMKYQTDQSPRKTFSRFRMFSNRIAKCSMHKAKFEKCCRYRKEHPDNIHLCHRLKEEQREKCLKNFKTDQ